MALDGPPRHDRVADEFALGCIRRAANAADFGRALVHIRFDSLAPTQHSREPGNAFVQRLRMRNGGGTTGRERHAERRVGAEPAQLRRSVEFAQARVERRLVGTVRRVERARDLAIHVGDRLRDAEAPITRRIAIAQLMRLGRAGRRTGGHAGAPDAAIVQHRVDFDRGPASRIEDFTRVQRADRGRFHPVSVPRRPFTRA